MTTAKNRTAATIQLTSEQLINESQKLFSQPNKNKKQHQELPIADASEYQSSLQLKRKSFESLLRRNRKRLRTYLEYAKFEMEQQDYRRMRSIMERGISEVGQSDDHVEIWIAYADFEGKGGFPNHALNVMHRGVGIHPKRDALWFKYVEMVRVCQKENENVRQVFEDWMKWEPSDDAWIAFIRFEERLGEKERAMDVWERLCGIRGDVKTYVRFAKWCETVIRQPDLARLVYERACGAGELTPEVNEQERSRADLWLAFAAFEARRGEGERVRAVYKHALEIVDERERGKVFAAYAAFERRTGGGDEVIVERRRQEYEAAVKSDPHDYDAWFDLIRLEASRWGVTSSSSEEVKERVRSVYSRAESTPPPLVTAGDAATKKTPEWRRFIYLFLFEAAWEEVVVGDRRLARLALNRGLKCVPHASFTFAKLWLAAARLEIRAGDLTMARKLLGNAIGVHPKDKVFREYIQLELQLGDVARCRILYEKYLKWGPTNGAAFCKYAELEAAVGEFQRARAIFELCVAQPVLDEPEKAWQRYIDFEVAQAQPTRAKALYQRLLERSEGSLRVWQAYAKFLAFCDEYGSREARHVLAQANQALKSKGEEGIEDRVLLYRFMLELEQNMLESALDGASQAAVDEARRNLPKRASTNEDDSKNWVFPQDEAKAKEEEERDPDKINERAKVDAMRRMLDSAQAWKRAKIT